MKTIIQKIEFKAPPQVLYEMYMDSRKHSLITRAKALVPREAGGSFSAYGGYIKGKNLALVPREWIVQSWRASDWGNKDRDSILILSFTRKKRGALVTMVHSGVPDKHAGHLNRGWKDHYWKPWAKFLSKRR